MIYKQPRIALLLMIGLATAVLAADFEPDQYTQEHVAGTWPRGYLNGQASAAMIWAGTPNIDAQGNIYMADPFYGIRVIEASTNRIWQIAGMDVRGYKDGPAQTAMFDLSKGGYPSASMVLDTNGSLYLADPGNKAIRKIWKSKDHGNQWWVSTYYRAMSSPSSLAIDSNGNLWTNDDAALYKIVADPNDESVGTVGCGPPNGCYPNVEYGKTCSHANDDGCVGVGVGAGDAVGHVHILSRNPWFRLYRVDISNGRIYRIAGGDFVAKQHYMCYGGVPTPEESATIIANKLALDGPALDALLYQDTNFAVTPDGKYVFFGNGDETNLRRLTVGTLGASPPFSDGYTQTLHYGGTTHYPSMGWYTDMCAFGGHYTYEDWTLGGPMGASVSPTGKITVYLHGDNPPYQLQLRKIVQQ